jgi:uncharacterized membrane protein
MGKLRERRKVREATLLNVSSGERELALETEFLERAETPLKEQEVQSRAFNLLWIDFFRMFCLIALAASVFVLIQSSLRSEWELFVFSCVSGLCFLTGRNWLGSVNVAFPNEQEWWIGPLSRKLIVFFLTVVIQVLFPVILRLQDKHKKLNNFFPSGLIFFIIALASVSYMRWGILRSQEFRKDL